MHTFLLIKVNWHEQPWQWDPSTTQFPRRIEGFTGKPIFSNVFLVQQTTKGLQVKITEPLSFNVNYFQPIQHDAKLVRLHSV